MPTINIGRINSGLPNSNKHPIPVCLAIELDKLYGEGEINGKYLSLSFSWLTVDPKTHVMGLGHATIPLSGPGNPKSTMGVFFLSHSQKNIVVNFENVKDGITVECIGKNVPEDFTLVYKVLN